nr:hypothetical protein [Methylobacterium sp. ZNC0032]
MPRFLLLNTPPSESISGGFLRAPVGTVDAVVVLNPEMPLMALVEELYAHALSLEPNGETDAEAPASDGC